MAKYKILVDHEKCIGCAACTVIAPDLFKLGEDGKSVPQKETIEDSDYDLAKQAEESCPTGAIKIIKIEE